MSFVEPSNLHQDNDVVVSTGAKAGTTWMLYCTHYIRVKGNEGPKPWVDVSITTPWPELLQHPEHTPMQQVTSTQPTAHRIAKKLCHQDIPPWVAPLQGGWRSLFVV